jgi:hypothetical protein
LPFALLTTVYILSAGEAPSLLVLLSFATSLLLLGCVPSLPRARLRYMSKQRKYEVGR